MPSETVIAFIGFGEAAQAFVEGWGDTPPARLTGYDHKIDAPETRAGKRAEFVARRVACLDSTAEAVAGADIVISVVTADQALRAAQAAAPALRPGATFFDLNSVSPATKAAAAAAVTRVGGTYVDVAVAAPVRPALLTVPMLVSADGNAEAAVARLDALGFNARRVDGGVGRASAIKMIRSIMIKGIEALTAECLLSAYAAGVEEEVLASLDGSFPNFDWALRADYNLDRMLVHGLRRAAEMEESSNTVRELGLGGGMAAAAAASHRRLGDLALPLPDTLEAKARAILAALGKDAA